MSVFASAGAGLAARERVSLDILLWFGPLMLGQSFASARWGRAAMSMRDIAGMRIRLLVICFALPLGSERADVGVVYIVR